MLFCKLVKGFAINVVGFNVLKLKAIVCQIKVFDNALTGRATAQMVDLVHGYKFR